MNKKAYSTVLVIAIAPLFALADSSIPITLIADTSTPDPSGSGTFTGFGIPSGDRDDSVYHNYGSNQFYFSSDVYFTAQGANGLSGVYMATFPAPGITEIIAMADTTMATPSGGNFATFSNTTSGQYEAGFIITDTNGAQYVYEYDGYGLHLIASTGTSPVSGTTFGNFNSISFMSDGPVNAAMGEIESSAGIYTFSSSFAPSFTLVANTSTIPPGATTPFTSFGPISYKAANPESEVSGFAYPESAVLATVNNVPGIYYSLTKTTVFQKLVDTSSAVPNGSGNFTSFGNPVATATYIEFTAGYSSSTGPQQGIFLYGPYLIGFNDPPRPQDNPKLQELLASGTVAPGSNGAHFASFSAIGNNEDIDGADSSSAIETYDVPFLATLDNGVQGLYCTSGIGTSVKILDTGDVLDGKTVSGITLSPDAAGALFTTFGVDFTDGSSGIYYFDTNVLPEPASLCLLALPMLLRSRRHG